MLELGPALLFFGFRLSPKLTWGSGALRTNAYEVGREGEGS